MKHRFISGDREFRLDVIMWCDHPNMKNNSTDSIGCNGACGKCRHGKASMTISEVMELLRRADCNHTLACVVTSEWTINIFSIDYLRR